MVLESGLSESGSASNDPPIADTLAATPADEQETVPDQPLTGHFPLSRPEDIQHCNVSPSGLSNTPHCPTSVCESASTEPWDLSFLVGDHAAAGATRDNPEEISAARDTIEHTPATPAILVPLLPTCVGIKAAIYVFGHVVPCAKPMPLAPYHTRGWHEPEDAFTWIDGVEGVLEMLVRRPSGACQLDLHVIPHRASGKPQTLEVYFNFFRLGRFEVPGPAILSVELPAELFILQKTRINLHCPDAVRPSEFGSTDRRRLGIAVAEWCIRSV